MNVFGDPILWDTKPQDQVPNSSIESEYMCIAPNAVCWDVMYTTHVCEVITREKIMPITYKDNRAILQLSNLEVAKRDAL